jgi:hypothetical protein
MFGRQNRESDPPFSRFWGDFPFPDSRVAGNRETGNHQTGRFPIGREPGIGVPIRRAGDFLVCPCPIRATVTSSASGKGESWATVPCQCQWYSASCRLLV